LCEVSVSLPVTVTKTEGLNTTVLSAVKVSVEDCPAVTAEGLKAAVIPEGNPDALN
jgi:hypothetical protein